jgi:hypothetical protein
MSGLLATLLGAPGLYRGRGDGAETGPFLARITVAPVVSARGVAIDYEATSDRRGLQHVEHSLLTVGEEGRPALHVLCTELPGIVRFAESRPGVFTAYDGGLTARILVTVPSPGHLTYAWWWSRDETDPKEQFRAEVRRTG